MELYVGKGYTNISTDLFDALLRASERSLNIAIDKGILVAHEAKSSYRHRILSDELAGLRNNIEFLVSHSTDSIPISRIEDFEKQYRKQVANRHKYIVPPHFDAQRKIPIAKLYVPSDLLQVSRKENPEDKNKLSISQFLSIAYRAVILGNPGGGKSTLASKLVHDLASDYDSRLFAGRSLTPILVILRQYGAIKQRRACSILDFIEQTANSDYSVRPPVGAFDYLLRNGRALVVFDGLDELLDTAYRQEITADVEAFCNIYSSAPALVTSREVGYEQAPLDETTFATYRLSAFEHKQVTEYVKKWFSVIGDYPPAEEKARIHAFLQESSLVPDLRANPLMLALMCNIYKGEGYIPKNRPDVYSKCAEMLFERWDKSRGIKQLLPFEAHIRPAMMYLAHWIYTHPTLVGGVTERDLVDKATEYLCPRRFEDPTEASHAAMGFIEFCRGRAWVFTDTGTTKRGERLYQFTHRTFLEYFTAADMVRRSSSTEELATQLLPRIAVREWDVVAQLAIQIQDRNRDLAGDDLLNRILAESRLSDNEKSLSLVLFAERCLEFLVPSPKVTRAIARAALDKLVAHGIQNRTNYSLDERTRPVEEVLDSLLLAPAENRKVIIDESHKMIDTFVEQSDDASAATALECAILTSVAHLDYRHNFTSGAEKAWTDFLADVLQRHAATIKILSRRDFPLARAAFLPGVFTLREFWDAYGVEGLFRPCISGNSSWTSIADWLLSIVINAGSHQEISEYYKRCFDECGLLSEFLVDTPTPWISDRSRASHITLDTPGDKSERTAPTTFDGRSKFVFFSILAVFMESNGGAIKAIQKGHHWLIDNFRSTFEGRAGLGLLNAEHIKAELERSGLNASEQAFALRWALREIDLVSSNKPAAAGNPSTDIS